jgi:hypothetical protein
MEKLTITEALSELNLIKKKVDNKRKVVAGSLLKAKHEKDAYESVGGIKQFITNELQSIDDLDSRYLKIKGSIAKANIDNSITVNGFTKTIHDWLNWKRDLSDIQKKFVFNLYSFPKGELERLSKQPQVYKDEKQEARLVEFESNIDYPSFLKKSEELNDTFDRLDGQLSLKNATIVIDF